MEPEQTSPGRSPSAVPVEDAAFVAALRSGSDEALGALAAECARDLLPQLKHRLGRRSRLDVDAEDVLQDAFLRAFGRLDDFQGETLREFQTWLFRIAVNRLFDVFRAARRERDREGRVVYTDLAEVEDAGRGVPRPVAAADGAGASVEVHCGARVAPRSDDRERLLDGARCVADADPGQREALVLRDLLTLPWESLEFLTGRTPEGTKSLYYRARRAARDRAEGESGAADPHA